MPGVLSLRFTRPDIVAQFGLPPTGIDILTGVSGLTFAEVWPDRVEAKIAGMEIPFLGRNALTKNKRASGRMKDLGDIEGLGEE